MNHSTANQRQFTKLGNGARTPRPGEPLPSERADEASALLRESALTANSYADWRARRGVGPALREEHGVPPERLLQALWHHQRLRRDQLTTLD
ncbi:MAG TPA: hypothetical protein VGK40_04660, partial [Verrucomicrobiae bacterium]